MAARAGGQGGKQPTINDVAALAGVSKKTVSRVINRSEFISEKTRKSVQQAIDTLGFVPNPQARALAFRRNFLIALLHDNPNAQTVLNFQQGVLDAIKDSDLALLVRPVDRGSDKLLDDVRLFLEKQRPIGAMLLPPISENDDLAKLCGDLGVRYVRVGSAPLDDARHCVSSNDREVVAEAVGKLIALGHRRIGFVRGPAGFRSAAEREEGFRAALAAAGLSLPDELYAPGNYRYTAGVEAGEAMLSLKEPPTAVFVSNDEMAAGVMSVAHGKGLSVPADLSIIGFDDSPTATHIWPALSTVRWPIREMGSRAARTLVADFLGSSAKAADDENPVMPSTFIERQSVAPPRG
ncbi:MULTISPECIES: LacI family DNA-binding transcriptional regulator [unclassified Sphingopyxis]|uniref:LacI family DNA-binding transcriptional regulator n=1 Tax=unclassified Sphingopyxis TaxID=2614943 RepID=UPI000730F4BD|nr:MULTISPECIES: LacI family DNA-binding transcriptional regulator [unclassified Sphingopyxis]KTE25134.1 LacI family transcriptional regulator [Sphingopyxis sp. H057]KTE53704.1 LacI family transcriptional regulator [Sphingopyxis sp. H073]KTE56296.1 LacI family transcriptional regulator [Sphingopyxis sp. H071]KTE61989.1 LacI family transcriptional regulator [Sphingopyxis sp. H107]KTE67262.1 LacI family transcriptional regulator [Sphingopyxis sp. H100]